MTVFDLVSKLLAPRPLPPNDQLEKLVPLMRRMLFHSGRVSHSECLSILSTLSKDQSPDLFRKFIDIQLFSPIFYLLRKQNSSSSSSGAVVVESGLEIIFNFCKFSAGNCQYLICLGLLPVFHLMLKKHALISGASICRCLVVIASSCPHLLSFDVLMECGLVFQVISEVKKKTPHADECFLLLTSFIVLPSHLTYLLHNDIILLIKSMLHAKSITEATTDKILSLLEKILSTRDGDALPLIAAADIQSMIAFELRKLMTSEDAEISRRAKVIMELDK